MTAFSIKFSNYVCRLSQSMTGTRERTCYDAQHLCFLGQMSYLAILAKVKNNSCMQQVILIRSKIESVLHSPMQHTSTQLNENQANSFPVILLTNKTKPKHNLKAQYLHFCCISFNLLFLAVHSFNTIRIIMDSWSVMHF